MKKIFIFEPLQCTRNINGNLVRPFRINGIHNIELNLNKLTDEAREKEEMERFCSEISKIVGKVINKEDLPSIIKNREIVIEG